LATWLGLAESLEAGPRPNVLFLFTDDQRADTIAALGNPVVQTPHLDSLVQRGACFTRVFCMGSQQPAVCVPSRAMLFSGRTLFHVDTQLRDTDTWPEAFRRAGYATFFSGKWHNGQASLARAFEQARSVYFGGMIDPLAMSTRDLAPDRQWTPLKRSPKHAVELFADEAAQFIASRKNQPQPWLCFIAFNAPHDPCIVPEDFAVRYDPAKMPLPANFLAEHPFDNGELAVRDELLLPRPRRPEAVRQVLADYYRAISFIDAQVGRILAALDESGQRERTIVVFTSDHGLAKGSHGLLGKQNLYEHSMRAPLIFSGPGVAAGTRPDAMGYLLDVFPTLGALAGVAAPRGSEGRSLADAVRGRGSSGRDVIFTAYRDVQRAVRDERYKLIVYPQAQRRQLFDLAADPQERTDLAPQPPSRAQLDRLAGRLSELEHELGDPLAR
jgi:arylsulfatase A-like enzyme